MIEPLPRWAGAIVAGIPLAGLAWWASALLAGEDSPWCDDGDSACPTEVIVDGNDRAAAVVCLEGSLDPSRRDRELAVRSRNDERSTGWSIRSVPIEVMVELPEGEELWGSPCDGTVVAIGREGSVAKADSILASQIVSGYSLGSDDLALLLSRLDQAQLPITTRRRASRALCNAW